MSFATLNAYFQTWTKNALLNLRHSITLNPITEPTVIFCHQLHSSVSVPLREGSKTLNAAPTKYREPVTKISYASISPKKYNALVNEGNTLTMLDFLPNRLCKSNHFSAYSRHRASCTSVASLKLTVSKIKKRIRG